MTPDKITIPFSMAKMYKDEGTLYKGVEYIRKDAILEWAKEIAENASWVSIDAVVNKIESL